MEIPHPGAPLPPKAEGLPAHLDSPQSPRTQGVRPPSLALHRALRRMAGLVSFSGFLGSGGRLSKARRGRGLLCNSSSLLHPPPRDLHRAPVNQAPSGPVWLPTALGFWSGRPLAAGTTWAGLCLIYHHPPPCDSSMAGRFVQCWRALAEERCRRFGLIGDRPRKYFFFARQRNFFLGTFSAKTGVLRSPRGD